MVMINEDNEWELSDTIYLKNEIVIIVLINDLKNLKSDRYIIGHFLKIFLKKTCIYRDIMNEKIDITGKLPTRILKQFLT